MVIAIVWASNYCIQGSRTPVYKISLDIESKGGSSAVLQESFSLLSLALPKITSLPTYLHTHTHT